LCPPPYIIKVIKTKWVRWVGHGPHTEGIRNAYKILVRKSESKSPFGRSRQRWENNIKMDLKEIEHEVDQIYEGCFQSSWTHLIALSQNSVEVQ
jgi:hypothetical protein